MPEKLVITVTFEERADDMDEIRFAFDQLTTELGYSPPWSMVEARPLRDYNGNAIARVTVRHEDDTAARLEYLRGLTAPPVKRTAEVAPAGNTPWGVPADVVRKIAREIGVLRERGTRDGEERVGGLVCSLELIMGTDEARDALGEYGIEVH